MTRTQLAAACALDALIGDPPSWPHPARAFGAAIDAVDRRRDTAAAPRRQLLDGALLTIVLAGVAAGTGYAVERRSSPLAIVLGATTLAARSLDGAVAAVQRALARDDLAAARRALGAIVGRDVDRLDAPAVVAAALESLAESFCDGVVAPLLWLRAGGLGAALAFKAISTLDSMIGHPEAPYTWFGRCAARADDVANFIPARIAAGALVLAGGDGRAALATALRDAPAHRSPNAGWPEAALAGALRVRLGGAATYDGVVTARPVLGAEFEPPCIAHLAAGRRLVVRATLVVAGAVLASAR
jgi:adenosylcobinamide-phosphate synthase